ncbi:hypothetical protein O6H91_Y161100 [Diphasiastrum complanatum]|nr:hypothetical protein O6H91_Y161100 [Diphasiastrum complanatum]
MEVPYGILEDISIYFHGDAYVRIYFYSKWNKGVSNIIRRVLHVNIDEVESLAAARQTALAGSEPSDSIRVVNALLTQLDKLKSWKNVVVLTTSNITAAVDIAFVDRADIKAYIGLPNLQACYEILRSCLKELLRTGIISLPMHAGTKEVDFLSFKTLIHWSTDSEQPCAEEESEASFHLSRSLLATAQACQGLSGRTLRKLPFLAHASLANKLICDCSKFLLILADTAQRELSERSCT